MDQTFFHKMAEIKTIQTDAIAAHFVNTFANSENQKQDSFELIELMKKQTACEPKMWSQAF